MPRRWKVRPLSTDLSDPGQPRGGPDLPVRHQLRDSAGGRLRRQEEPGDRPSRFGVGVRKVGWDKERGKALLYAIFCVVFAQFPYFLGNAVIQSGVYM